MENITHLNENQLNSACTIDWRILYDKTINFFVLLQKKLMDLRTD